MMNVPLYAGKGKNKIIVGYAKVDNEDYDRVMQHRWYLMKLYHCKTDIQYARRYEGKTNHGTYKAILLHRFVMNEFDRKKEVDHINHNGLDNQKENLRCVSHRDNLKNVRSRKTFGFSKYNGVIKYVSSWGCRGSVGGKRVHFSFNTENEAALAHNYLSYFSGKKGDFNDIYR